MAIITQELQQISSRMDKMRKLIQQYPQHASTLFREHPELCSQIREIVHLLRELQSDTQEIEENKPKTLS
ncbi:hypothetical protein QNI19_19415 [Cytophagaceae bacterium DM2B3-1]|uniref:Uncharacterized protein n=1 Tax=Xanthocytophaga flava TaxID=3048013 RepID=A0AAE3QRZ4_9BACT|nr:hypothetical protein [Xanthocytophaga flavus]MDJ1472120.1 hypothetical protein [Xanthocytophaga flavus]MDJ1484377.1 hypothetical protein [Xanthocytophaga flavus]MDJ1495117.1 hypothetical protein [Xanthocytophaga flavus]